MTGPLRCIGRVSACVASGLLETLMPRHKSAAEEFFAVSILLRPLTRTPTTEQDCL